MHGQIGRPNLNGHHHDTLSTTLDWFERNLCTAFFKHTNDTRADDTHAFAHPTAITGNVSGDWVQCQIILNNNVVAETHFLYQRWGTIHLIGAVPVATGNAEIKIGFKLPSRNSSSTLNTQMFYYSGGNLLAINRYR